MPRTVKELDQLGEERKQGHKVRRGNTDKKKNDHAG